MNAKIFLALLGLFCLSCFSAEIEVNLRGESAPKTIGIAIDKGVSPYHWDVAMHHPPAHKIILGGAHWDTLTFTVKSGANSVTIPAPEIVGMQYKLAQSASIIDVSSAAKTSVNGNLVTVIGQEIGDKAFDFGEITATPFSHFRPIIAFDENLASYFKKSSTNESMPTGQYSGIFKAQMQYDYYREGFKIKHHVSFPIKVKINFSANSITNISITGSNEMWTRYYGYPTKLVDGKTSYHVKVATLLSKGIYVRLKNSDHDDNRFYLEEIFPDQGKEPVKIPFGVFCSNCAQNEFINIHGEPKLDATKAIKAPESFELSVEFRGALLDELPHGDYQGSFVLIFEPAL